MICPKCNSENVVIQEVPEVESKTKYRGCLGWCCWLLLACCTLGLILIIPLITNSKTKTKTKIKKICTCQECAYSWEIK